MKCPYCQHTDSKVLYTIYVSSRKDTVRRRTCLKCERRFTTEEVVKSLDKQAKDAKKQSA